MQVLCTLAGFVHVWHQNVLFFRLFAVGEPQVFQTYIFATKKQKRRIETLNMFFSFNNFLMKKNHRVFKYNEHFSTTL